jgi:hypothetical protein
MSPVLREVFGTLAALVCFWLAWRTVRTGMPAGNAKVSPRRDERPIQFWFVFALYIGLGVWWGGQACDLV